MRGLELSLIHKFRKGSSLHELIDQGRTGGVIVEILEVHLKEMHLFFNLLEDDLIVPVVPRLLENSHKEELIQFPYLVDIHEDGEGFLTSDDLAIDQGCLEVGDNDAQIPDVALLCV